MQRLRRRPGSLALMAGVVLLVVGLFIVDPSVTQAAGCTVGSGYASIQAAVNDGNCTTISVPAGTYTENVTINRSVTINGSTTGSTIVDGNHVGAVFSIDGAAPVVLTNLTLQHGIGDKDVNGNGVGGAIFNGGYLTLTNSTIRDNSARTGGGIFSNGSGMVVINTTFSNNIASDSGGGIDSDVDLTVINSTFSGNNADYGGFCMSPQKSAVGLKPLFCSYIGEQKSDIFADKMAQNV